MSVGSVCRHLKIVGRVAISRFFHVVSRTYGSCNTTSLRLLIGEPRQSSQVAPVGAGQISAIGMRQVLADRGSHGGFQRKRTYVNPRLQMTGAGLQHHARLVSMGPHGLEDRWRNPVQIQQNVAGVSAFCIGMDVDITPLAVTNAQEPDGGRIPQLGGGPQSFAREWPSAGVVDQTNQEQIMRHCLQLTADRVQREPQSVDTRRWLGSWLAGKRALYGGTLQATGRTTRILNRPRKVCADPRHANSENQLASSSQKERLFFSER